MAKPDLTPRQQQASALWTKQFKRYIILDIVIFWGAVFLVLRLSLWLGWDASAITRNGGIGALTGGSTVGITVLAQRQAMAAVRRAGLLDESRETVGRTATTFEGENLAFEYPSHPLGKAALVLGVGAFAAAMWWFWRYFAQGPLDTAIGALGFALFAMLTLLTIATLGLPNASLDERGVFAYRFGVWPRLVRWHEIESAHFWHWTSFQSGATVSTVTLKDANDKTLLVLNTNTFLGATPAWKEQFIAELRRRLTGADATSTEEASDG